MKLVQPIRDLEVLQRCFEIAREHDRHRKTGEVCWELILLVGLNTSVRVSDFRRFKVGDLRGRDYAQIQAKKTGKEARILINPTARKEINRLLAGRRPAHGNYEKGMMRDGGSRTCDQCQGSI